MRYTFATLHSCNIHVCRYTYIHFKQSFYPLKELIKHHKNQNAKFIRHGMNLDTLVSERKKSFAKRRKR